MMQTTEKKPLTAAQKKQRTLKHRAWLRAAVQLMFFIAMPGAFVAGFNGVKQLFLRIGHGEVLQLDSFTLSLLGLCGFTILFGRFFCGHVCAFGSLGDGVWWLSGLVQKKLNLSGWKEAVLGILCIVASFAVGMNCPLIFGKATWSYITFVYIFFAAVLPMWLLKQPRDYMTTFMFICMIAGAVVGLLVAHPTMNLPVFTGFNNEKLGTMFPILFVTVACGAVSGFHSLVSSGTSSKTVENEKDMLKVGYGAMILESLLAVLALCVAGAAAAADGTPAAGTPFQIFSRGVAGFFEMFGVPAYAATVFMTMCVSALALTSLDAVARIGRMSFQELFSVDDMEHAEGWRKLFCNVYFSTFITLVFGFILTKIGYANIWPLFGSANQLLSALVLATLCVFLKVTGRSNKMLFPPLVIMLCVTFTALVQRLIAMVKAISTAASVTIPAGETTWGAVFIANGLQLIIAILLIVLGITIVVNSFKSYAKSEKNSEKASA